MAATQTANYMPMSNAKIEISANGSTWTDISGETNTVDPGDQSRTNGEMYTVAGDTAVVTAGKREPLEITVKVIYTEATGEAFEVVRAIHETAGGVCYLRYAPKGGATGDAQYTSAKGVLIALTYPSTDAGDGKPVMAGFKVKTPSLTRALIAS